MRGIVLNIRSLTDPILFQTAVNIDRLGLLKFPTLVGNLSVFVLSFLIKVCPTSSADLYVFVLSFVYYY